MLQRRKSVGVPLAQELNNAEIRSDSASPRRRLSIIQGESSVTLGVNDDAAERLLLRNGAQHTPSVNSDRRRSLGLTLIAQMSSTEMTDRITQCIKLSSENKINTKNAFSLKMIDVMTYMIKKNDSSMDDLQVASTTLDVSTKIYGFRVDNVHAGILKMTGCLGKQDENDKSLDDDTNNNNNDDKPESEDVVQKTKRKNKREKRNIIATVEALRGNEEGASQMVLINSEGTDTQTTDTLYQTVLAHRTDVEYFLQLHCTDILQTLPKEPVNEDDFEVPSIIIGDLSNLDLNPTLEDLQLNDNNDKNESQVQENESQYHFDINASIHDEPDNARPTFFDMDMEENEATIDRCNQQRKQFENIVDFQEVLTAPISTKQLEYSYIQKGIIKNWAGPVFWKYQAPKYANSSVGSRVVEACRQGAVKKKKEIVLEENSEIQNKCKEMFKQGKSTKLQLKTLKQYWQKEKVIYPEDIHYDILNLCKLYHYPSLTFSYQNHDNVDTSQLNDEEEQVYNYNNEHDRSSYCPLANTDNEGDTNECDEFSPAQDTEPCSTSLTGDNLVTAPRLPENVCIKYALKSKNIDMRQLKHGIWKCLTKEFEKESIDPEEAEKENANSGNKNRQAQFSSVYRQLLKVMSKDIVEDLSTPLVYVSMLHLANEKNLCIQSTEDRSNFIISEDTRT
ncbi:condensin complex subunit 2 [Orussus abietinus]|uniref:condensin complex subunit 2 n=1 Tax=Orussus abietinus TaxID=222816 RepID=UPI0006259B3A|nr:condensin complex subunit 2 [Orussus abietinus]